MNMQVCAWHKPDSVNDREPGFDVDVADLHQDAVLVDVSRFIGRLRDRNHLVLLRAFVDLLDGELLPKLSPFQIICLFPFIMMRAPLPAKHIFLNSK